MYKCAIYSAKFPVQRSACSLCTAVGVSHANRFVWCVCMYVTWCVFVQLCMVLCWHCSWTESKTIFPMETIKVYLFLYCGKALSCRSILRFCDSFLKKKIKDCEHFYFIFYVFRRKWHNTISIINPSFGQTLFFINNNINASLYPSFTLISSWCKLPPSPDNL